MVVELSDMILQDCFPAEHHLTNVAEIISLYQLTKVHSKQTKTGCKIICWYSLGGKWRLYWMCRLKKEKIWFSFGFYFLTIEYIGLSYKEANRACLIFDFTFTKFDNWFSWI